MGYVSFNKKLTKAQIEALRDATNGKIYFATDGGIYIGGSDGRAYKKSDIGTITGITMNGSSQGTSGVVNLGNIATVSNFGSEDEVPIFTGATGAGSITSSGLSISSFEQNSNKSTSISSSSTDTEYPSAKAAYDAITGAQVFVPGTGTPSAILKGSGSTASGNYSVAEGSSTTAAGLYSHAEGSVSKANSNYSHAEGNGTTARGSAAHTEGFTSETGGTATSNTKSAGTQTAAGSYAHAEGNATIAQGANSHSEGKQTFAQGATSHAEGEKTEAKGDTSHAEGYYTTAQNASEHSQGRYNDSHKANTTFGNAGNTIHSIGIGTSSSAKKNAFEVMQNGDAYLYGLGTYNGTNPTSGTNDVKTIINSKAPLASPALTGSPTAPTQTASDNSTKIATTAFVKTAVSNGQVFIPGTGTSSAVLKGGGGSATGINAVAEGFDTLASGNGSHAEGGWEEEEEGDYTVIASGTNSHAEGRRTTASGEASHAEGNYTTASGGSSHAEGSYSKAIGEGSHAEGAISYAHGLYSHVEGSGDPEEESDLTISGSSTTYTTSSTSSLKVGYVIYCNNKYARVESIDSATSFTVDVTLGTLSNASAKFIHHSSYGAISHAEGYNTIASGMVSHAEGYSTVASDTATHAEGYGTEASNVFSHAEGFSTTASGGNSHSEGASTIAAGANAHTEGYATIATNESEHAQGQFNKSNKASTTFGNAGNTLHSIGIGTANNARANAVEVMQNGDVYVKGVGTYNGTNPTSGTNDLQTIVNAKAPIASPALTGTPTAPTASAGTNTTQIATTAFVKKAVDDAVANATHYVDDFNASSGAITGGGTLTSVAEKIGDMYTVSTAGTYVGTVLQVGDSIIFKRAVAAGTAPVAADITIVQGTVPVSDNNPTLAWNTQSTVGTVEGVALHVTLPTNPNTDTHVSGASFSGNTSGVNGVRMTLTREGTVTTSVTGDIPVMTNTIYGVAKLGDSTQHTISGKVYGVAKNASNQLCVNVPWTDTDTTYTFAGGTNSFTVTPSGGTAQTITVAPEIENNVIQDTPWEESGRVVVTGDEENSIAQSNYTIESSVPANAVFTDRYVNSAAFADDTSASAESPLKMTLTRAGSDAATVTANLPKVSSTSAGVAPMGSAVSSQTQSTKFLREDGTWAAPSYSTVPTLSSLTLSKTAQAYDGTHTLALPSSDPYTTARTPSSHTHGNITNDGKVGSTAGLPLITGTNGVVTTGSFGTASGTFAEGNHNHDTVYTSYDYDEEHSDGEIVVFANDGQGGDVKGSGKYLNNYVAKAGDTMTGVLKVNVDIPGAIEVHRTSTSGGSFIDYYPVNQTTNYWRVGGNVSKDFVFTYYTNSTANSLATLTKSGSLGIGTTSPSYKLDVQGSVRANNDLRSGAGNIYVGETSGSRCHQQYDATNKCLKFIFD